ncbi:CCA tRNA nucleotidyltransferase [Lederbergia sp. NSJ-179]|uniref:CCA tRNA nucleotidyltransferase n=1 Tax=Lederbergia sp. NSJ-179 TaxID=2931402 RepID=UPI001FD4F072|nr:CCA tRNA nucleotidyltransferase [Lederbergia sp. NSJ-179]MCJ7839479.1 CCA tRNA nucleotidyltransferase [Lederbergia sp. NSJ-179]
MNKVFLLAKPIIHQLKAAGYEAYYVGGAVRDYILKRDIHDVDIATSATPAEVKAIFPKTVDVGIEHGTILVILEGRGYEVTTFRADTNYVDFRRPETVTFIRSLEEDLQRRDFTINAMAMDEEGKIIDPFHGQEAIQNKQIKTVGSPAERFGEDALRLMRAVRFVSQLGFELDATTEQALIKHAPLLQHIAIERIYAEMEKLLTGKYKKLALQLARNTQLFHFWPSIFNKEWILDQVLDMAIQRLNGSELWLLGLYLEADEDPQNQLKKWKLPAKEIKKLIRALSFLKWRVKNNWTTIQLYRAGSEIATMVEKLVCVLHHQEPEANIAKIKKEFADFPILHRSQLVISGNDILQWIKKSPGSWMGDLFDDLEMAILNKEIPNQREMIRKWVETWKNPSKDK